jgi:hypothetical protein
MPLVQTNPGGQALGHEPQCIGSVFRSVGWKLQQSQFPADGTASLHPLQSDFVPISVQMPMQHCSVAGLHTPWQPPQQLTSLRVSQHTPLHGDNPGGHSQRHVSGSWVMPTAGHGAHAIRHMHVVGSMYQPAVQASLQWPPQATSVGSQHTP